jgi:uncharacterized protein YcbX
MAGEPLENADVRSEGIAGDRDLQVLDAHGRVITSRSRPALLAHRGTLDSRGDTLVDGRPWDSSDVRRDIEAAAGPGARLVRSTGRKRFDILPLLVATDGAIAAFGHDRRRLRPNLVIGNVPGLAERDWEGRRLRIGKVLIGIEELRERCIMTTFDPDTQVQDVEVLQGIRRDFGGRLALNAWVIEAGTIAVGDPVELD